MAKTKIQQTAIVEKNAKLTDGKEKGQKSKVREKEKKDKNKKHE